MINIKAVKKNWFRYILFFLLFLRILILIFELNHKGYSVDHRNSYVFFEGRKGENFDGINISSRKIKIFFPEIYPHFFQKDRPSIQSSEKSKMKSDSLRHQEDSKETRFYLISYGYVSNELLKRISETKNDKLESKVLKKELYTLLKQNSFQDSIKTTLLYNNKIYEFYTSKTKGYSLFTNILNNRQNPKKLLLDLVYISSGSYYGIEIILFLLALTISSFYVKLLDLRTTVEKYVFGLIVLHLLPIYFLKANYIMLVNLDLTPILNAISWAIINLIILNTINKPNKLIKIFKFISIICPFLAFFFVFLDFFISNILIAIFIISGIIAKKQMSEFRKIIYKKWDHLATVPLIRAAIFALELYLINHFIYPYIDAQFIQDLNIFIVYIFISIIFNFVAMMCVGPAAIFNIDLKKYIIIKKAYYFFSFYSLLISLIWFIVFSLNFEPNIVLIFLLAYLILKLVFLRLKFLEPIKFDVKKEISVYLSVAFKQISIKELSEFTISFLSEKFNKTNFAFISHRIKYGHDFNEFFEAIDLVPVEIEYLNLDIERSNITKFANPFPEEPDENEIKLFFRIKIDENMKLFFVAGSSSKLFWIKEEADFIFEITKIFQNALDAINLNIRFRNKQIAFEKEMEKARNQQEYSKVLEGKNFQLAEEKQKILDSIEYASLIQNSILPRNKEISEYIKDYFIFWKPKDIVGGDFYWFFPIPESKNYIISVIDCTGHGVPGAFMSMTANSILNNIVREKKIYESDKILNFLHKEIRYTLRQQSREAQQDGMDISICYIDVNSQKVHFSGAMQSIYFVNGENGEVEKKIERIRGNRFSIGGRQKEKERIFTNHITHYNSGDSIYLLSDGLADQKVKISGKEQRFKTKRVKEMLLKYCSLPMKEQKEIIEEKLAELQGDIEQRDDITVFGIRLI
ncbi:MAG: SpoIIE family protein phosphatase [Candidatus Cloacimonetes bacterium]|nr:SpoIIE family protein phosphatase [Candidatus Cloacimonadota bacterium]